MKDPAPMRVTERVAWITLDRPEKRNALNAALVDGISRALREAETAEGVGVIVLSGAGKDFCAGADLADLAHIADGGVEAGLEDADRLGRLFVQMRRSAKPLIAAVHGRALAGGCGLATACDLILASRTAQFGYPEVHLGFVPAMVMAILRRKVGESNAFALVAGGERIAAAEAVRMGLVHRIFDDGVFEDEVRAFAEELAQRPATALALTKRLLYGLDGLGFEEGIRRGAEVNAIARTTDACREGVRAFLERKREG